MVNSMRILLTIFAFIATYLMVYWLPFSLIQLPDQYRIVANLVSLIVAVAVSVFVFKKTAGTSHSLASSIVLGGVIVGAVGFIAGFFGPLIFTPESNLGPLLGIFLTGPIGFVVGLIGGAVYWKVKKSKAIS